VGNDALELNRLVDQYRRRLKTPDPASIEELLTLAEVHLRPRLLCRLIEIENESREAKGAKMGLEERIRRFPEYEGLLRDVDASGGSEFQLASGHSGSSSNDATVAQQGVHYVEHFRLISLLGQGSFGTVWKAFDTQLRRNVAVKFPRYQATSEENLRLFLREARAVAALRHPNIVAVYSVGETEGRPYLVTELVEGRTLRSFLREGRFTIRESVEMVSTLARALHHAHGQGVVHRDLKPSNILIDGAGHPHIIDFGLAKKSAGQDSLVAEGRIVGTPLYMAPEQAQGNNQSTDFRADLYALGTILFELITGQVPFQGDLAHLFEQIAHSPPPRPRRLNPQIDVDLERICLKCLSKKASDRYQSGDVLAADLQLFLAGQTLRGLPVPVTRRVRNWFRRKKWGVIGGALALSLGAFIVWYFSPPVPLDPEVTPRPVRLTSEPEGAEITVIPLDKISGEPDPGLIQRISAPAPVVSDLAPGNYLVVAVLKDRWHEVLRHVPGPKEDISSVHIHKRWKVDSAGIVELPTVVLPRPDISSNMLFVDAGALSVNAASSAAQALNVPDFYIDKTHLTREMIGSAPWGQDPRISTHDDGSILTTFDRSVELAEQSGKRLPSLVEVRRLSSSSKSASPPEGDGINSARVSGKNLAEGFWTTTRNSMVLDDNVQRIAARPMGQAHRAVAYPSTPAAAGAGTEYQFLLMTEGINNQLRSRFVRSARPRVTAADFPRQEK
jgi:serine/threonine protein kinase